MRLLAIMSCVAAISAGCDTMRCGSLCGPSRPKVHTTACQPTPAFIPGTPPIPPVKPPTLQPTHLPTLQEVRGPEATELRAQRPAVGTNSNGDVLLIPRLVYVPYSPYSPTASSRPPGNSPTGAASPYVQAGERMTVLPPVGAPALSNRETLEECLQQMKLLNARIAELEARTAAHSEPAAPAMLPIPPTQ
ncbi:MAG TPA: hypothetical protein VN641_17665 [Urbifossiella sp.]|nr:hypothetical protein [Urbifossiella sp.]